MKSIHEELKKLRLEKGITLEELNESTKISITILEKMEAGDFTIVPQPFIRAFLREYAEVIGVDPDSVINRYENKADSRIKPQPFSPAQEKDTLKSTAEDEIIKEKAGKIEPESQPEESDISSESVEKPEPSKKAASGKKAETDHEIAIDENAQVSVDQNLNPANSVRIELEKPESSILQEKSADTAESTQRLQPATHGERQRLEIEETNPMYTISILIFIVIIIIAALVIFWINRGF